MFPPLTLTKPGLFVTATDTEVGKTTVACAIAHALRANGQKVGVCKPFASGCRTEREGLVSGDAEALAHFADCREPLETISPVRFKAPLAPAAAAKLENVTVDWPIAAEALERLDASHDCLIVEGIGGWRVPLTDRATVEDLAAWLGFPVLVVARPDLGTLNHTAMTCQLVRNAGLSLAGVVINGADPDPHDLAEKTNPAWIETQNQTRVLGRFPKAQGVEPERGRIPETVLQAATTIDWAAQIARSRPTALGDPGGKG